MDTSHSQIVSFIWSIADDVLRDVFLRGQYRDVILPMVVLRRLDALLEPTKQEVEEEIQETGINNIDEGVLKDITGLSYFNTSKWTLNRLKSQASDNNDLLYDNFVEYLNGYSENVRDVLRNFEYYTKARKLADNDRLLSMIEKITDPHINLTDKDARDPDGLPLPALTNIDMGTVFEELLRRFNEENNEEAGEHFTPRDAISLLAHLVFYPVKDNLPKVITLHDPAEGSGGMLTEGREYLLDLGVRSNAILLSGTEINPETYAISKSDLIIKGGVSPVADAPAAQKILISDITAESWVYIYPSGPVSLAQLAWSKDMSAVNTALPAPAPKAAPASFTAGEATDVTITWEPVENAGSYSVVFSGKTYAADGLSYTIEGKTTGMLDPGSYAVKVFANPGKEDIYNTQSEAGVATFAVLPAGGSGESSEFIVASVEDLLAAIDAGKDFITLKYSDTPYEIGALTLVAPLHLKGQESDGKKTAINASITLSGAIGGSVVFRNLDITSSSAGTATSFLIDDKTADNAPVLDTVAVYDSNLHGTKALYDNSGKAVSNVQNVIFKGNIITDSSAGADYIDLRNGAHHNFVFENNTVANSCRTVFRTDATHEMNTALIKNNTFYKVATAAPPVPASTATSW